MTFLFMSLLKMIQYFIIYTPMDDEVLITEQEIKKQQELQEVLKFPIEIFGNLEASLKSELLCFLILWIIDIDKQRNRVHIIQFRRSF